MPTATDEVSTPAPHQVPTLDALSRRATFGVLLLADIVSLSAAIVAGQLIDVAINGRIGSGQAVASLVYLPVFLAVMAGYGLYRRGRRRLVGSFFPDISHLIHSLIVGSVLVLLLSAGLHRLDQFPNVDRTGIAFTGLIAICTVPLVRVVARYLRAQHRTSRILIVGSGVVASTVTSRLQKIDGVDLVGCVDDIEVIKDGPANTVPLLGRLEEMPALVAKHHVDHVVVAFSLVSSAKLAELLRTLPPEVRISVVPRLFDLLTVRSTVDELFGLPVVDVAPAAIGAADRFGKRALDITVSAIGLLVASIPMLIITAMVKLTSPGPVLFRQRRAGRRGRTFEICKFRTMRVGAEQEQQTVKNEVDGPLFKAREDPRVTSVGRLLRKTSLDELPQLFNVLKGDMSLVGPRPFVVSEADEFDGWSVRRFDVRPGMTGVWQVSGRNDLPFAELCRLDYAYVSSWSLWWDLRILWHTPATVLRRRGAY